MVPARQAHEKEEQPDLRHDDERDHDPQVAAALMEEVPTIRARIRRKTFQVTVRQENGNPQYVLLADLVRFLVTGEVQPQPDMRPARKPRNPHGLNGKRRRGRPHKVEQLKTQQVGGRP